MRTLISLAALAGGIWLITLGYNRQHSLVGKADASLATLGTKVDGEGHIPTHVKYYAAGAILAVGGALGLGLIKK
jgi:hypothetical protein